MIPATIATLAMAVLVYAFILSPIIRELRGGSLDGRPVGADVGVDVDDDDVSAAVDTPQTAADDGTGVVSQQADAARGAERTGAGARTTTTSGASASASDA